MQRKWNRLPRSHLPFASLRLSFTHDFWKTAPTFTTSKHLIRHYYSTHSTLQHFYLQTVKSRTISSFPHQPNIVEHNLSLRSLAYHQPVRRVWVRDAHQYAIRVHPLRAVHFAFTDTCSFMQLYACKVHYSHMHHDRVYWEIMTSRTCNNAIANTSIANFFAHQS